MSTNILENQLTRGVNNLRAFGLSDEQIAKNMQLDLPIVQGVKHPRPQPDRARAVQHMQLIKMAQTLMPKVEEGDPGAITLMIKVQRREADLLGLDAPKEIISQNFNHNDNLPIRKRTTAELEQILAESQAIEGEATRVEQG